MFKWTASAYVYREKDQARGRAPAPDHYLFRGEAKTIRVASQAICVALDKLEQKNRDRRVIPSSVWIWEVGDAPGARAGGALEDDVRETRKEARTLPADARKSPLAGKQSGPVGEGVPKVPRGGTKRRRRAAGKQEQPMGKKR